jgi:hypothetical protein
MYPKNCPQPEFPVRKISYIFVAIYRLYKMYNALIRKELNVLRFKMRNYQICGELSSSSDQNAQRCLPVPLLNTRF